MFYRTVLDGSGDAPRVADRLLALRAALRSEVPAKCVGDQILLATWNIREFGGRKYGGRSDEAIAYIAEILSHFDLVAVQEVRDARTGLNRVLSALGSWWKVLYTDVTDGTSGNAERLAFLYDSRVVTFDGLAGEIVLPKGKDDTQLQFARTPFTCGFRAGWKRLELSTVHIYYGDGVPDDARRVREIGDFAKFLAKRAKANTSFADPHTIVLGDFNIFNREDVTFQQLKKSGFDIPEALQSIPGSNVDHDKHYDQIAFLRSSRTLEVAKAGVFDFFQHVYRHDKKTKVSDAKTYAVSEKTFRQWRTYQMSDHLPMWVALKVDAADEYLRLRRGAGVTRER